MARFKVGVQLRPEHTTIEDLRRAWRAADALGVDTIYTWDHFFPLSGDPHGRHFEGYTLLAAMAVETRQARFGMMVTCNSYRNPDLLADMARTVDHLSGGRHILGLGAGWKQQDYDEYGYEFGTPATRLKALGKALPRIKARLARLNPPPIGPLPLLIGGAGEQVTLRLVARYGDLWNSFGPPERWAHKNAVLNDWCAKAERDPATIERTVMFSAHEVDNFEAYLAVGAQHLIVGIGHPFDLDPARRLLAHARSTVV